MGVPAFPVTYTMIALWVYEKCSTRDGSFYTYKHGLRMAAGIAEPMWINNPVFRTVAYFDPDGTALSEFMRERALYKTCPFCTSFFAFCASPVPLTAFVAQH